MERDKRFTLTGWNSAGDRMYSRTYGAAVAEADYSDLTKAELQALLADRGLPTSGNKDELIQRLEEG